jgi:cytochrome c1
VAAGRTVVATLDCGVCHDIPGIVGADGIVGPPLAGFGRRTLIAGLLPNEPDLLAQWVRDAPSLVPNTGMPDLPISDAEAANVAAFLYTLR